ncbi:MAG: phosphoglucosamine mutase [Planctomycetota bacterium]
MSETTEQNQPAAADPLMLSVSGMRGIVGGSLRPEDAARFGGVFGSWVKAGGGGAVVSPTGRPVVALGRDSRRSGRALADAAAAGLMAAGCDVVRLGVLSTPGVAIAARRLGAAGALVVTASHNPAPWNGLKPIRADGSSPPAHESAELIERFKQGDIDRVSADGCGQSWSFDGGAAWHAEAVLRHIDIEVVRSAGLRVVVDSVCGAGGVEARLLLEALGVEMVSMHAEPTGVFPHTPEPTAENLTGLCEATAKAEAHAGFAQDPDADRLAIVDEAGVYLGEEYTLALCVAHRLERGGLAAANLSTSRMIDDVAARCDGRVIRTRVGEANVAGAMREHGCEWGGEGNGGIIWSKVGQVRDSLVGMALICEMLAKRGAALSRIAQEVPAYAIVKAKAPVSDAVVAALGDKLPEAFPDARADAQDGVRLDWAQAWLHVRPSNTEPIVRLIAEAPTQAEAQRLIDAARAALGIDPA